MNETSHIRRVSIRPTLRTVIGFGLSVPLALVIVTMFPAFWYGSFYLPAAVIALALADGVTALSNGRLSVSVHVPKRLGVGQAGHIDCHVTARGHSGRTSLELLLELEGETKTPVPEIHTLADGSLECALPVTPSRRGRLLVAALWGRWHGPLGLVEFRRRGTIGETIDVVPDVKGIHEEAIRFFSTEAIHGVKTQRARGEGTEFDALREYAPGMDIRYMDWKRSARHHKLLSKEFRQERNHQIVLCFDTGHLMIESIDGVPKLDHAIKAGLLLGWVSLRGGDLIGGCGFDARLNSFLKPGQGMHYFSQFQQFSASLAYDAEETNYTLGLTEMNSRLGRRALIVLFTDFVDTTSAELLFESLQVLLRRHLVVFVTMRDPLLGTLRDTRPTDFQTAAEAVIADDFLRERAIVLERIARLGAHCLDVTAGSMSAALLSRYLMIKQRGLL